MPTKRRARRKFTWLPTIGTAGAAASDNASGREFELDTNANGTTNVIISELTFDEPSEGDFLDSTFNKLSEIIGSEWFLKRVVGKLFIGRVTLSAPDPEQTAHPGILVGAGFFVARSDDRQGPAGAKQPIGSATLTERVENYNPLGEECIREPWLWRRTWVIGGDSNRNLGESGFRNFPASNAFYGSMSDGPHIDARTARRIGQDDRLFFAVATMGLPIGQIVDEPTVIDGYLDFRLLGALRRARGDGKF